MMWHTHEQRLLTPEESPTMEQAHNFLQEHADVVLYSGQDTSCAPTPSLSQHAPTTTCVPRAESPPVANDVSIRAEEEALHSDLVAFEPCLTRITVKVCYGGDELLLASDQMCYSLLR